MSGFVGDVDSIPAERWEQMHFLLRKCAHFSEYFILGILMRLTVLQTGITHKFKMGMLACILVAVTDETIQRFVSGRSGQLSDVLLDCVGALCGIGCVMLMGKIRRCFLTNL